MIGRRDDVAIFSGLCPVRVYGSMLVEWPSGALYWSNDSAGSDRVLLVPDAATARSLLICGDGWLWVGEDLDVYAVQVEGQRSPFYAKVLG